ncbi:MAG: chorismate synthase [Acidobacteria bacterium]|nr:chorismate synthase [Acidobacteriota bacterium]MBV9067788.1 chorismate synthase [Acidobacteriota bacterium]MBV9184893.1 chorismate synthase [Acidobacteriota bacterium]
MSRFTFLSAGESHGPQLTVIVTGMPAGVLLDRERINRDMARRQHGYGRGGRMKIEHDEAEIAGGIRGGETLGSPIAIVIRNDDFKNWEGAMGVWDVDTAEAEKRRVHAPRPGHVDLIGGMKYDRRDLRDVLERASARETASRVAAGAIAKELLRNFGIEFRSGVVSLGAAGNPDHAPTWDELAAVDDDSPLRAVNKDAEAAMVAEVDSAREAGETLGGTIVVAAHNVPIGLGSYVQWNEKLDGRIAQAILSIHAVKAVAIGDGVAAAQRAGSEVHDPIYFDAERGYHRTTNRAGGLEGGVTNGQDVVVRAYMKPISTLRRGLPSVDIETREPHRSQWERSDVTAVPACGVVCEAMLAITLADAMREKFGGDSLREMVSNFENYVARISTY